MKCFPFIYWSFYSIDGSTELGYKDLVRLHLQCRQLLVLGRPGQSRQPGNRQEDEGWWEDRIIKVPSVMDGWDLDQSDRPNQRLSRINGEMAEP